MKLSTTSKLDGIRSWSLQALKTCPGSIDQSNGDLVPACKGCYATGGNYRFATVKAPRLHNQRDWKRDDWEAEMIQAIGNDPYFRWFDSGDMYALTLAWKIYRVMKGTPSTKHWLPTRMHKFSKFGEVLAAMEALPNAMVRRSSDSIHGEFESGIHGSTIIHHADDAPEGVTVCHAYDRGGKCSGCRACWDKTVDVIGYVAHGKTMIKLIAA